jgi:hypothetical protein
VSSIRSSHPFIQLPAHPTIPLSLKTNKPDEDKFGHILMAPHDPLEDMPRHEVVLRLPEVVPDATEAERALPFRLKRDDLGRLVVASCKGPLMARAGVVPGFHLTRIGDRHHVWPPARRRLGRWFVVQKLLKEGPRPLKLAFEKAYPAQQIRVSE